MSNEKTKITENELFPRRCSISSKGMNSGWYFEEQDMYISNRDSLDWQMDEWEMDTDEELNKVNTDEEWFYYTEWDEIDEDEIAYDEDGNEFYFADGEWKPLPKTNVEIIKTLYDRLNSCHMIMAQTAETMIEWNAENEQSEMYAKLMSELAENESIFRNV